MLFINSRFSVGHFLNVYEFLIAAMTQIHEFVSFNTLLFFSTLNRDLQQIKHQFAPYSYNLKQIFFQIFSRTHRGKNRKNKV